MGVTVLIFVATRYRGYFGSYCPYKLIAGGCLTTMVACLEVYAPGESIVGQDLSISESASPVNIKLIPSWYMVKIREFLFSSVVDIFLGDRTFIRV